MFYVRRFRHDASLALRPIHSFSCDVAFPRRPIQTEARVCKDSATEWDRGGFLDHRDRPPSETYGHFRDFLVLSSVVSAKMIKGCLTSCKTKQSLTIVVHDDSFIIDIMLRDYLHTGTFDQSIALGKSLTDSIY